MVQNLNFLTKTYEQLTKEELYAVLRLRAEVFVVEQNCVYQDIDQKDQKALHVLGFSQGKLIAYARIFRPNDYFEYASIGRVIVAKNERHHKYGYRLMHIAIQSINTYFNETKIAISAQQHLKSFYTNLGFKQQKNMYLEDGIPHIYMVKNTDHFKAI